MTDLRYPIGRLSFDPDVTPARRLEWIGQIASAPAALRAATAGLSDPQFDTPYRPGGWSVRQLVHHVADSHMNAYIRFKLALTEPEPTIKPYDETAWAELPDTVRTPVDVSLTLLEALHRRWTALLESMTSDDFARGLIHPVNGPMTLDRVLQLYAWHGRHHTAHVTELRRRENL